MTTRTFLILACIVLVGEMLRTINLSGNPPGFFADEAVIGVDAYSLLHHGTDHLGNPPHFLFPALGDYRGFVQIVSAVPFVGILGLNENAVRITSALYGILTILLIYAITALWFNGTTALVSALLLAISPWHIHMSRIGFEFISFPFWFLLAVYLFIQKSRHSSISAALSAIAFGITLYTYQPARLFVPIFLCVLFPAYWHSRIRHKKRMFLIVGITLFFMALPLLLQLFSGQSLARFQDTSILFQTVPWPKKILDMIHTYRNYFSYDFLFSKGDSGFPGQFITRHSVLGIGLLYIAQLPFLLAGIILAILQWKLPRWRILLGWLILYPVAGALVGNIVPFATRGIIGVIPIQIFTAYGISTSFSAITKQSKRLVLFFAILMISVGIFSLSLYVHAWQRYPLVSADYWGWQYGARPIMEYFLQHRSQYDDMYMSPDGFNAPEIFTSFYDPTDRCAGKCRIGNTDHYQPGKKLLFAIPADHMNFERSYLHVVRIIYYPNTKPAFFIAETL